jgi:hypothetical protein
MREQLLNLAREWLASAMGERAPSDTGGSLRHG